MGRSLVQRSPTDCGVSLCVIYKPQECGSPGPRLDCCPERERRTKSYIGWTTASVARNDSVTVNGRKDVYSDAVFSNLKIMGEKALKKVSQHSKTECVCSGAEITDW